MVYVTVNYVACYLCLALIYSVCRLPNRSSSDIFVAGLCTSCFVLSATCGTQCLLNVIQGHFAYGKGACYSEALFHFVAILTMFQSLTLMAYDSHKTVATGESIGAKNAVVLLIASWVGSAIGIGLFSLGSPIYMSPSGVFCFFSFDSLIMYAFVLPIFVITFVAMIYYYYRIFQITRLALNRMSSLSVTIGDERKQMQLRLAKKLLLFVLFFFVGWTPLMLAILLKLIINTVFELDAIGGVFGVFHSIFVPISYGFINPRLRLLLVQHVLCGLKLKYIVESRVTDVSRFDTSVKESSHGIGSGHGGGSHGVGSCGSPLVGKKYHERSSRGLTTVKGESGAVGKDRDIDKEDGDENELILPGQAPMSPTGHTKADETQIGTSRPGPDDYLHEHSTTVNVNQSTPQLTPNLAPLSPNQPSASSSSRTSLLSPLRTRANSPSLLLPPPAIGNMQVTIAPSHQLVVATDH